ncbi:hypothetical protein, partial [Parvibaculum sp.]|uniref:hypothetical protein n=1 Tax=Parvibaculum sp. TaxID=2024848 RepID=UPI0038B2B971
MNQKMIAIAVPICTMILPTSAALGSFTVDRWDLATRIHDSNDTVQDGSVTVSNPFSQQYDVALGASQAHSYFDFSWTPDTASFLITASHIAFDGNGGTRSISSGNIYLTPSVDLFLTATGTYDYDLPAWAMQVAHGLDIFVDSSHPYSWGDFENTFLQGPISGAFHLSEQGILPAGSSVTISYAMHVDGFGNSGLLAEGHGNILITLQPVPEPMTLTMLALGAVSLSRRVRRHSSS